ncbi:hypothetical protein SCALIN_C11_0076 [Candidatus Scalindua japonica]|uniref:Transposase IS4-like domain-containing protein n=1 Tax=Candidatus Scalindua japonica TaxID=1284222 RepID=A0A286TX53_9BACT|nr:transposase [Candidatus Scalindua japonica]GAX60465.1 hypothetical protein SCALIN_C11_0076 [Candidatus Scalindua japonica]
MVEKGPNINPYEYFENPSLVNQKKYEALKSFFYEKESAEKVAAKFGYTLSSFYSLTRDFRNYLKAPKTEDMFFLVSKPGRKEKDFDGEIYSLIINLRKQYLSIPDIKSILDSKSYKASEKYIWEVLRKEGFARLPRRSKQARHTAGANNKIEAPISVAMDYIPERFTTQNTIGIFCLLPYMRKYKIDVAINNSLYPETSTINKYSSILSFIALKISNVRRYSVDDLWCMDRGLGLFAGLTVLPKTGWFSSYSSRVTRKMNLSFLKNLHRIWKNNGLLSDTMNLDFTAIPYWGDDSQRENNWSGKRNKALSSMLAVLAQEPDSGIIDYTDSNIRHNNEPEVVLEFLDFYRDGNPKDTSLKYIVFDSKFTPYKNLRKLDSKDLKFITIRNRGKKIVEKLDNLPSTSWKKIRVMNADGKGRTLKVFEEKFFLDGYGKEIRQIAITGHGKIKPALIITNDDDITQEDIVRKYSRRWIVEKGISEQIEFFHLNRVSSSMVIKADFDLTMSVLAHNLYRLLAMNLPGYTHNTSTTLFEKFLCNSGEIEITSEKIIVRMKKKRNLPALLNEMEKFENIVIPGMDNKKLVITGSSTT